jgi:muramoyltetrapeptide carboxypeptidase
MIYVLKPPALRKGDRIGVISPAGPIREDELRGGLEMLESYGFDVRVGDHVFSNRDYLAGEDELRLADLHAMFEDKEIKAIFCSRGGYGTLRLLDRIDYSLIRDNPKIFAGYSDITALLMAICKNTGLITFHGPMVRNFTGDAQANLNNLLDLLSSGQPVKLDLAGGKTFVPGKAKGPLVGGNLSMICHLVGTPFLPSFNGCILFLEETGEPLYRIDRMLTHLKLSGLLNDISGLVAGTFDNCGEMADIEWLLKDVGPDLGIPVATGLPAGHGAKNTAIPLGVMAELDTDKMVLSIPDPVVTTQVQNSPEP